MPFDQELYDGIYCYALIHLLNAEERMKLIHDCYNQLKPNGIMVFIAISTTDGRYGNGREVSKDAFEMPFGVTLYFYDSDSIKKEFGNAGLIESEEVWEPLLKVGNMPSQRFWQIVCKKTV